MSCDVDDLLEDFDEQARAPLTHNDEANKHDVWGAIDKCMDHCSDKQGHYIRRKATTSCIRASTKSAQTSKM